MPLISAGIYAPFAGLRIAVSLEIGCRGHDPQVHAPIVAAEVPRPTLGGSINEDREFCLWFPPLCHQQQQDFEAHDD